MSVHQRHGYRVQAGTTQITYTLGSGCIITTTLTVYAVPAAITGLSHLCVGQSTGLSDASAGGTWSSSATGVATVGVTDGVVTGVTAGTAMISYSLGTGCTAAMSFTVVPVPSVIIGDSVICVGNTATLSDLTLGGIWTSGNTSIATIDSSSGFVTGRSSGTVLISYTVGSGCMAIGSIIVNPVSAVNGPSMVCAGQSITVSDSTEGGTWSSSSTVATVVYSGDTPGW